MNSLNEIEKKLILDLKEKGLIDRPPLIEQERFDIIVENLINDDCRELMFRLCVSYPNYNYNKVIDYYIKKRDSWYIEEFVSAIGGVLNQEYLVQKMIETNDKVFIRNSLNLCNYCMESFLKPHLLTKIYLFLEMYDI